jgi:hypothetical protein
MASDVFIFRHISDVTNDMSHYAHGKNAQYGALSFS